MTKLQVALSAIGAWYINHITYLGLDNTAIIMLGVLVLFDMISGVIAAKAMHQEVKSSIGIKGFLRKLAVMAIPFVLGYYSKGTGYEIESVINTIMGFLMTWEAYSTLGNITTIVTGKKITEEAALGNILQYILDFLKSKLTLTPPKG